MSEQQPAFTPPISAVQAEHEGFPFGTLVTHYTDYPNLAAVFMVVPTPPRHHKKSEFRDIHAANTHVPVVAFMPYMIPLHKGKRVYSLEGDIKDKVWYLRKSELLIIKTIAPLVHMEYAIHAKTFDPDVAAEIARFEAELAQANATPDDIVSELETEHEQNNQILGSEQEQTASDSPSNSESTHQNSEDDIL